MTTKPWDRRPDESDPAWTAFTAYRDAGPGRTLKAATAATGRRPSSDRQLEGWSAKHEWVARVRAWDGFVDQAAQARVKAQAVERRVRQANLGRAMQGVAGQGLSALSDRIKKDPKSIRGHEVAHLAKVGFDIEAVAEGDPNEIVGGGLEVRVVNLTDLTDPRKAKST